MSDFDPFRSPDSGDSADPARPFEPPPSSADAVRPMRVRFRRWLWRKSPYFLVLMLLTVLALVLFWNRMVIVVGSGQAGVLYRLWGGTQIDYVYLEGVHFINPLNRMYIYDTRKQVARHEFDVLTVKGMSIHLALAIRFHPEIRLLGMLHQRIGSDYLNNVIIPQTESVMRKRLGNYTAEDIYTNKEGLMTNAIVLARNEVGRNFVQVEDIIIRGIQLPDTIKAAIEEKLVQEELFKSYEFRVQTAQKEAQRVRIEAEGVKDHNATVEKSLTDKILQYRGIQATRELAQSNNAKVIVIGAGQGGLPMILNTP